MRRGIHRIGSILLAAVMVLTLAAMPMEGLLTGVFAAEPTAYMVVDDCDTADNFLGCRVDTSKKMQGTGSLAISANGQITLQNNRPLDIALTQEMRDGWYLEFWMYLSNKSNLVLGDSAVELMQTADNTASIKFRKLTLAAKGDSNWYKVQVKLSDLSYVKGSSQFTSITQVRIVLGTSGNVDVRLDDICLSAAKEAGDISALEAAVAEGEIVGKEDLSGYAAANVEAFNKALAQGKKRLAGFSQRDVDVATAMLKNAINAFGMEGFEEDAEAYVAYIDFNTKKYSRIDRYAILNADGKAGSVTTEAVAGKNAALFSGEVKLAVNDEYVSATDKTMRVTFTYYDGEAGTLTMNYNSADNAAKVGGSATFGNTGLWKRKSIKVTDAMLSEAIDGRCDLKIALSGAATAYITRIEIKVVTADDVTEKDVPEFAPMTDINNFADKSVAGYQMWFTAGDRWVHWASGNIPSNDKVSFEMWPDISEYPDSVMANTAFNNLGDGRPAKLFTSVKEETVDLHVSWMKEAGLDGFAIQRFYGRYDSGTDGDNLNLRLAAAAAEKYDRVFYVMYDLNGALASGNQAAEVLKSDFVRNVEQTGVIQSTSYAQMDGRPVVCMWGIDPTSDSYANHDATMEFICWLQDRGYYVIGGTSNNNWYDGTNSFTDVYRQLDMISPWTVGRYGFGNVAKWMDEHVTQDVAACEEFGIDYQPVILAGSSWHNHNWGMPNDQPRRAGNFLWRQAYLLKTKYNCERVYFAMFDEYDEATAITKAAQDSYDIPEDEQYFSTLSIDGTWLSSDFYLRMAGTIGEIMRSDVEMPFDYDIPHSQGPIYWRNSFEKRWTYVRQEDDTVSNGRRTVGVTLAPLDVCLPSGSLESCGDNVELIIKEYECKDYVDFVEGDTSYKAYGTNTVGTGLHCDTSKTRTSNGTWSLQFNGTSTGGSQGWCTYRVAATNIMVSSAGLELSYDVYAASELGKNVYVDLLLQVNGVNKLLSDLTNEVKTDKATVGKWTNRTVTLPASLVGQKVVAVLIGFESKTAGEFNAYIDDVVLQSAGDARAMLQAAVKTAKALDVTSEALNAAVAAGEKVLADSTVVNKDRLAAMKAIDTVIREEGLTAIGVELGDVDGNGKVNTTDARLTLQYAAGRIEESALNTGVADVDGNGKVNTTDARLILQKAAGRIKEFPAEKK